MAPDRSEPPAGASAVGSTPPRATRPTSGRQNSRRGIVGYGDLVERGGVCRARYRWLPDPVGVRPRLLVARRGAGAYCGGSASAAARLADFA